MQHLRSLRPRGGPRSVGRWVVLVSSVAFALLGWSVPALAAANATSSKATTGATASPGGGGATLPLELAPATVTLGARTATIEFASRIVTGPLRVGEVSLGSDHTELRFEVTPVLFLARSISVGGPVGGSIHGLTIRATTSGVSVGLALRRADQTPVIDVHDDRVTVRIPAAPARR